MPECLRCRKKELRRIEARFFECAKCQRQFTLHEGGVLTERWLGPLSLTLYGVQFSEQPEAEAPRIAADLRADRSPADCAQIAAEIRLELAQPTQPVRQILPGTRGSEEALRRFLQAVADNLSA